MNAASDFSSFISDLGFQPPANIEPGRWMRFPTKDKRGDSAGSAKLYPDCMGGIVYDWRTGQSWDWKDENAKPATEAERIAWRERVERARQEAEAERQREEAEAAQKAARIWESSSPAPERHSYLHRKRVPAYGLRIYSGPRLVIRDMDCSGALILPLRDSAGTMRSLEFIDARGDKRFLPGGSYLGAYHPIGQPGDVIVICEGYATGASIHRATGYAVRIAATGGNLEHVANAIREKSPTAKIIIASDNDLTVVCHKHKADGTTKPLSPFEHRPDWCKCNPGVTNALQAARVAHALIIVPELAGEGKDFNDLEAEGGNVKEQIEAAKEPPANGVKAPMAPERDAGKDIDAQPSGWPEPDRLPELPPVPPFDYDVLPAVLRAYVRDISERMQCPPEFPAVVSIVMAGTAIGRKIVIRPKQHDSWQVVPNLWAMNIGRPGIMKTPAQSEAFKPLKRMEAKAAEDYEIAKDEFEVKSKAAKLKAADSEARARETLRKDKYANIDDLLKSSEQLAEPKPRRYIVNDTTPEKVCEIHSTNPAGVLVERDELIGWLKSLEKEGHQDAKSLYLTGWNGDQSHTVDRITRGTSRIDGLCISLVGGIQPGVLAGYVRDTQRGGSGDDGLLQRFSLMVYPDLTGDWKNVDREPDREARDAVHKLIERLCNLTPEQAGAEIDPYGELPFLRFDDAAQELFIAWLTDLETTKIRSGEDHPAIVSHLAKYRKAVPALSLINHLCDGGIGPVTEASLARAITFIELLEKHARRVYSFASRPELDAAKTILAKLRKGKLPIQFKAQDIYRAGWSGLNTPEETASALNLLRDYGYVRDSTDTNTGGRPSTTWRAHPSTKGQP